jgi:electron transfer flavoprotein beta subunit
LVPEEQDVVVNDDRSISWDRAEWKVGDYDLTGIEAAMQLAEASDGKVTAMSVGAHELDNSKLRKSVLAHGPEELICATDDSFAGIDAYQTACLLKSAVDKLGGVDLVVCGDGSADIYAQQVGPVLGELLGWANVNAVSAVTYDAASGDLEVERTLDDGTEELHVELPAVLSIASDFAEARIPSMKDILSAGKKPVNEWSAADLDALVPSCLEVESVMAPPEAERLQQVYDDGENGIEQFAAALKAKL